MDFPAEPAREAPAPEGLVAALGAEPVWVGRNRLDYLVELDSEKRLRTLQPDPTLLRGIDARGVIVTAAATGTTYDYTSRFFCPRLGIDEDPVTGSAHCALAPFWSERLGRPALVGYQVSTRGGRVQTRTEGVRVVLGGQAVTVMRAELI